jgi:hypothetical protein
MRWKPKIKITLKSIVIIIGVCCIGSGLGSVVGYMYGQSEITAFYGGPPMSFVTSVGFLCVGIALFILGSHKIHNDHDELRG